MPPTKIKYDVRMAGHHTSYSANLNKLCTEAVPTIRQEALSESVLGDYNCSIAHDRRTFEVDKFELSVLETDVTFRQRGQVRLCIVLFEFLH